MDPEVLNLPLYLVKGHPTYLGLNYEHFQILIFYIGTIITHLKIKIS